MGGFSLDLGSRNKKIGKKKRSNVFGEDEQGKKKNKIKLTHVDEHQETHDTKLIIEPETLKSSLYDTKVPIRKDKVDNKPKYGLIKGDSSDRKNKSFNSQGRYNVRLPDENLLPEMTREEEYEKVPIEDFGEALLRGMGWDGREDIKTDRDSPAPRPQFLGLGAKALPKSDYVNSNKSQEESYMPVIKINKETGKRQSEMKGE